jgi:hypothetical protein
MHAFIAPALRANDALGFLAALGVVALAEQGEIEPLRLRWEQGTAPRAIFESGVYDSVKDLAQALAALAGRLKANDAAIPGVRPDFPYARRRANDTVAGADPMRMSPEAARETYRDAEEDWYEGKPWFARWVIALLALASRDPAGKAVRLTPFNAPFGQMKFRDSYFDQARNYVASNQGAPLDAFTGWVRLNGYVGANLDERAIRDASLATDGKPNNAGAPSPTWLALMALRFFPLADDGHRQRLQTVGWRDRVLYPDATRRTLVWPVWEPPLEAPAIRVLLAHPDLDAALEERLGRKAAGRLRALGVTALYGASRRTRTQGDGPLGPAVRLWP